MPVLQTGYSITARICYNLNGACIHGTHHGDAKTLAELAA